MCWCLSSVYLPVWMHLLDVWLWFQLSTYFYLVLVCFPLGRCFLLSTTRGLSCAWELSHRWPLIRWVLLPTSSLQMSCGGHVWRGQYESVRFVLGPLNQKNHFLKSPSLAHHPLRKVTISNLMQWKDKTFFFPHWNLWPQDVEFYFLRESVYF